MPHADSPSAASDLSRLAAGLAGADPLTWVITGDSITHGFVHTHGERSYAEHLHELIRGELARTHDILINSAISGHRITDILGDFNRRVASWRPCVVTLMIGTNDMSTGPGAPQVTPSAFGDSLVEAVWRIRDLSAVPVLQTPPSIDVAHAPERARLTEFADAVRAVSAAEGTILVDQLARFTELGNGGVPWGMMNDPFHPNAAGHAALALELAEALGIRPASSRTLLRLEAQVTAARLA